MDKEIKSYKIDDWTIDPKRGLAFIKDEKVHLEPKSIELLNHLATRPGEVVSRAELLKAVWPNVIVGDEVITNTIAKLRKALRDDPRKPRLIETIPKRGYRIATKVTEIKPQDTTVEKDLSFWTSEKKAILVIFPVLIIFGLYIFFSAEKVQKSTLPFPNKPSVAVLPFTNLSDNKDQEYFVDGITEDLITDLSRVSGLFVIARNSSFLYKSNAIDIKEVGRELGVNYLVEGSVRDIGPQLRINIQLIDVNTGGHLWSERYDSTINDIFILQEKITSQIVDALSVKMTVLEKNYNRLQDTHKLAAYDAFLKGWAAYKMDTPDDFAKAIMYFNTAIDEDPDYAHALAALASIYWESYQKRWHRRLGLSPISAVWQKANEYLDKSMIFPTPLAHKVTSSMLVTNRRYEEAITEAKRAIDIDPNDPQGYAALANAYLYWGKPDTAEKFITQAIRLDPKNPASYMLILGNVQLMKKKLEPAIQSFVQTTQNHPDNRLAWMALLSAYGLTAQTEKAKSVLIKLDELQKRDKLVKFTVGSAREYLPFHDANDLRFFLEGLRKAGVPEW